MSRTGRRHEGGAASVEHAALAALVALIAIAAIAALRASPPGAATRELGSAIARRIACAPRHPVPCGRNPLALAYGFPVGKLVRFLAPAPEALPGPEGLLVPVDFRRCRRASCAAPGARTGLTASLRRATAFTSVEDLRPGGGPVRVTYWLYRPALGWERVIREAGEADLAAASAIRLNLADVPVLVPLETLAGRNHVRFPRGEEPPWRWAVPSA
jgi:Flp pilus assembly pilin Flp